MSKWTMFICFLCRLRHISFKDEPNGNSKWFVFGFSETQDYTYSTYGNIRLSKKTSSNPNHFIMWIKYTSTLHTCMFWAKYIWKQLGIFTPTCIFWGFQNSKYFVSKTWNHYLICTNCYHGKKKCFVFIFIGG